MSKEKQPKERVTIRLDEDLMKYFRDQSEVTGAPYQTLINRALRVVVFNEGRNFNAMSLRRHIEEK